MNFIVKKMPTNYPENTTLICINEIFGWLVEFGVETGTGLGTGLNCWSDVEKLKKLSKTEYLVTK